MRLIRSSNPSGSDQDSIASQDDEYEEGDKRNADKCNESHKQAATSKFLEALAFFAALALS